MLVATKNLNKAHQLIILEVVEREENSLKTFRFENTRHARWTFESDVSWMKNIFYTWKIEVQKYCFIHVYTILTWALCWICMFEDLITDRTFPTKKKSKPLILKKRSNIFPEHRLQLSRTKGGGSTIKHLFVICKNVGWNIESYLNTMLRKAAKR